MRIRTLIVLCSFTTSCLFADVIPADPSLQASQSEIPAEEPADEGVVSQEPIIQDRQTQEAKIDLFLKGGYCVMTAILFMVGLLVVKSHEGQRTPASA